MMNKKGATFSTWTEGILVSLLVIIILGVIMINMNTDYNEDYDPSLGFATNETLSDFNNLQQSFGDAVKQGQTSQTSAVGLTISTAPSLVLRTIGILWSFLTGSWIDNAVQLLNLGEFQFTVTLVLKILFFFSIAYFLITILFKVIA